MYDSRRYIILNINDLHLVDFSKVLETGPDTIRKNIDETLTFVKYEGEVPECLANLPSKQGPYSHDEMISILDGPEWTNTTGM